MKVTDVLSIAENEILPHNVRCAAQALLIAMLALDRYGHTMSYSVDGGSEADQDGGLTARRALEDIRVVERRPH